MLSSINSNEFDHFACHWVLSLVDSNEFNHFTCHWEQRKVDIIASTTQPYSLKPIKYDFCRDADNIASPV